MSYSIFRPIAAVLVALAALVAADPGARASTRPPKLNYTMTTLPNGLKVVFLEDHSTPIVHTEMWYHVGSKNERPGRTGFAHLFEHMMFKGSKNVEPEGHPSLISSIGGQSNAYTDEDATVFWQTTPAQYLPLVLWLEADRLASLRIEEDVFKNERQVVKEERRMRVDESAVRPAERAHLQPGVHGRTPTSTRRSAAWRISRPRPFPTSAISSGPTTCPTTRRWCSSEISTRRRRRSW